MQSLLENESFKALSSQLTKNDELEISLFPALIGMTTDKATLLIKYFKTTGKKIQTTNTLNVIYNYNHDYLSVYRITIDGIENINKIINEFSDKENHMIFNTLSQRSKPYISMMDKQKTKENMVDLRNLGCRVRKARELAVASITNPAYIDRKYITYRYIQRVSLILEDTPTHTVSIDLSFVKTNTNITHLESMPEQLELEIDVSAKKDITDTKKITHLLGATFENLLKLVQQSNIPMIAEEQTTVINKLHALLSPNDQVVMKDLPGMQSVSAEITHIIDDINHDYCVTDKADGDRYFMFILDDSLYLISNNVQIKKVETSSSFSPFNKTVIDGEYIYNKETGKFMFMAFDCLMFKGTDVRNEAETYKRIMMARECIETLFEQKQFFNKYEKTEFDVDKIREHYIKDIKQYMDGVNKVLKTSKRNNVILLKYFAFPLGIHYSEIFALTSCIWEQYTTGVKCPYTIDGCMLTPINQIYTKLPKQIKKRIFKIKPAKYNSIDFYITFQRDPITNQIVDVYNDSQANANTMTTTEDEEDDDYVAKGMLYRIVYLHAFRAVGQQHIPVPFREETEDHFAYLIIKDGQVRDVEGNIIQDKTVVEFAYNNDPKIPQGLRWIPLRTRHDKTEFVKRFKKKYGNNEQIANRVWSSIINGVEMEDIKLLGNPDTFEAHKTKLKQLITDEMIHDERRYHDNREKPIPGFNDYNNFVKTNLIVNYTKKKYGKKMYVLDYACGQGGDIPKFYQARIGGAVGIEKDHAGLKRSDNSAEYRYNDFNKKKPKDIRFPMDFIVADGGVKLNVEDQERAMGVYSEENTKLIKTIFDTKSPRKYDIINCQFAIHYFFKDDNTLDNFMYNISTFIKPGGIVLITTLDDEVLDMQLNQAENNTLSLTFTNKEGEKETFYEIIKMYNKKSDRTGMAINVHVPTFVQGKYEVEYLVPKNLLISKMKEKGLRLIDTASFKELFVNFRQFLQDYSEHEEKPEMKRFYMKLKNYYDNDDEANVKSYEFLFRNRLYVFQKNI